MKYFLLSYLILFGIVVAVGGCETHEDRLEAKSKQFEKEQEIAKENYAKVQEERRRRQESEIGYIVKHITQPAVYKAGKKDKEVVWALEEGRYYLRLAYYNANLPDKIIEVPKNVFDQAKVGDAWLNNKLFPKPEIK